MAMDSRTLDGMTSWPMLDIVTMSVVRIPPGKS